ncbi:HNH endonuclease [Morganella morganii]|nr:hypothetical protein [Morganella morganii]EMB6212805.1 hypothetical protein [Morganella morganii]
MELDKNINFIENNYEVISFYYLGRGTKKYIGSKSDPCRFCGRAEPDVTFKTIAHAVPEFLGNKQLILKNECDSCNKFFSENLENHLDKYTKHYRTASQVKGKKKIPSHTSKDKKTRFDIYSGDKPTTICSRENSSLTKLDVKNKTLTYIFEVEPHIPAAVYKCLVKIGISIIPECEVANFKHTIQWINNPNHSRHFLKPLTLLSSFIPGPKPNKKLTIFVLKKLDLVSTKPSYLLVMGFGNLTYQIIVPSDLDTKLGGPDLVFRVPTPFDKGWQYGPPQKNVVDLTNSELVFDMKVPMTFSADAVIEVPITEYNNLSI